MNRREILDYYAMTYGPIINDIAYEAISNAGSIVGLVRPHSKSAILLPEGLTRYLRDDNVAFCYRADIEEKLSAPRRDANIRLEQEFNAVSQYYGISVAFRIILRPYGVHQVMVVAKPILSGRC